MPSSEGVWESFVWTFDSKKLGNAGLLYWPVTLQLYNVSRHDNVIAVTDIRLQDTRGNQLIKNGDFSAGPDRWFFASDFEHLAWHPKNVLLYLFFEQGVFGLLAVLLALGVGVARQFRAMLQGSVLAIGLVTALVAMLAAGITGTLLDAPRIAMLWYMLLLLSVQLPTHPATKPSVGRARQVPGRGRRRGVTPI